LRKEHLSVWILLNNFGLEKFSQNIMFKISAIVQARMGSTRLPGKIMKIISGHPVLWHVIDRLKHSKKLNNVIIATTILKEDDVVENFCKENNILFFRGSVEDVLSRYFLTAQKFGCENIVRITSDCPVIDPEIIDNMIEEFFAANGKKTNIDYLSNSLEKTFPRGLDSEIFTFKTLEKTFNEASKLYEKEHVTPYIYQHPELFKLKNYSSSKNYSDLRWTLDTEEDFQLIKEIYSNLYNRNSIFLFNDILNLMEKKPNLKNININIKQKKLGE
jgi:spore coat polysaccharide biosynthesis protein SpsF